MFPIYVVHPPERDVRAEEIRYCKVCKKKTKHRYEEVSFHARVMFVKVFCTKKRYIRICSVCNTGEEMEKEKFDSEIDRLIFPDGHGSDKSADLSGDDNEPIPRFMRSKKEGIKYCRQCGQKVFPDVGYCTACAVRGSEEKKKKRTIKRKRIKRKKKKSK